MRLVFALLMLFAGHAYAQQWSDTDKTLAGIAASAFVADWAQSRYIARNPDQFHERNPLIQNNTSTGRVDAYFAAAAIAGYLLVRAVPHEYRTVTLAVMASIEVFAVGSNHRIGVRLRF